MSRAKGVVVEGRLRWVWSDAHDVVLALMIETTATLDLVPPEWRADWRICACLPDVAFSTAEAPSAAERDALRHVLHLTRALARQRGDVTRAQVRSWVLGEALVVCGGDLATDAVAVEQLVEVIDGCLELLDGDRGEAVILGAPRTSPSFATSASVGRVVRIESDVICLDAHGEIVEGADPRGTARRSEGHADDAVFFHAARADAGEKLFLVYGGAPGAASLSDAALASMERREQASVVHVEEDGPGRVCARLLGRADRRAVALALAVVKVSWGWDDSPSLVITVDSEPFHVTTSFDSDAQQWSAVAVPVPCASANVVG